MIASLLVTLSALVAAPLPADLLIDLPQQTQQGAMVSGRVPSGFAKCNQLSHQQSHPIANM